jgi:hypothetical protein
MIVLICVILDYILGYKPLYFLVFVLIVIIPDVSMIVVFKQVVTTVSFCVNKSYLYGIMSFYFLAFVLIVIALAPVY